MTSRRDERGPRRRDRGATAPPQAHAGLGLHDFYRSLGFTVKAVGEPLVVDDTEVPASDGYVDVVKALTDSPTAVLR